MSINVTSALDVLDDLYGRLEALNGRSHSDPDPTVRLSKDDSREKARVASELQFISSRLELTAALVRNEYWHARGEADPLNPERKD